MVSVVIVIRTREYSTYPLSLFCNHLGLSPGQVFVAWDTPNTFMRWFCGPNNLRPQFPKSQNKFMIQSYVTIQVGKKFLSTLQAVNTLILRRMLYAILVCIFRFSLICIFGKKNSFHLCKCQKSAWKTSSDIHLCSNYSQIRNFKIALHYIFSLGKS